MTEEKYLEIRGFKYVGAGNWQWPPTSALFTQEGALKCQLQEDRDMYNFVLERVVWYLQQSAAKVQQSGRGRKLGGAGRRDVSVDERLTGGTHERRS